jgi:Uma2 family endonuclease
MVTRAIVLGPEFDSFQDDTEEMLVGSSFHQDAIVGIFDSLRVVRDRRQLPWFVGNQLKLLIPRDSGMPAAQPSPDIVVHLTLGPTGRYSIDVHVDGPPAFAAEVLSPSTARDRDLNDRTPPGKPLIYAACGIAEYLTFDPLQEFIPEQVRAWRLGPARRYVPWLPDADGFWWSVPLKVAFRPRGFMLDVYDEHRRLVPRSEHIPWLEEQLTVRDQQLAERDRLIAELEAELRRLRGQREG